MFLNRRLREHRSLTLAELIHRKIDIDADFSYEFLGSENEHISKNIDKETLFRTHVSNEDRYEYETFDHMECILWVKSYLTQYQ